MIDEPFAGLVRQDALHMAEAFEGVHGALVAGLPLEWDELADLCQCAQWVWAAGPEPVPRRDEDFAATLREFQRAGRRYVAGMKENNLVADWSHRLARHMHHVAGWAGDARMRKELPIEVANRIALLATRFSKYAAAPHDTNAGPSRPAWRR